MQINNNAPLKTKTALAEKLGISRASLYYQPKLPAKDLKLKSEIEKVMHDHNAYGHRRIALELKINKKRVLRVMKLFNLKPKRKKRKPVKPGDLKTVPLAIPNLLKEIVVRKSHQAWVSDFTYLPYYGKFVYLATIEDVYTRRILNWNVSVRHNTQLIIDTLLPTLIKYPQPEIIHSDQGSEYRSQEYLNLLKKFWHKDFHVC